MLEVLNLTKFYGSRLACFEVSFSAGPGEVVGFLGPNGAGKTTTIRLLSTYLRPDSGTALVAGCDLCREPEGVREQIGYLPQTPPLYDELNVAEYLRFVGRLRGLRSAELRIAIECVVEQCNLEEVYKSLCGHLSQGYRQRVGLAQALLHQPKVLILDEPTNGLDPTQVKSTCELIRKIGRGRTVLVSTHQLSEVSAYCTKVVIINQGQVVLEQEMSKLEHSLEQTFLRRTGALPAVSDWGVAR